MSHAPCSSTSPASVLLTTAAPNTPTALILTSPEMRSPKFKRWLLLGVVAFIGGYWVVDPMRVRTVDMFHRQLNDLPVTEVLEADKSAQVKALEQERGQGRATPLALESSRLASPLSAAAATPLASSLLSDAAGRSAPFDLERLGDLKGQEATSTTATAKPAQGKPDAVKNADVASSNAKRQKGGAAVKGSRKGKETKASSHALRKGGAAKSKKAVSSEARGGKAKSKKS